MIWLKNASQLGPRNLESLKSIHATIMDGLSMCKDGAIGKQEVQARGILKTGEEDQ